MAITLSRSKIDQTGDGQTCVIPFGNDRRTGQYVKGEHLVLDKDRYVASTSTGGVAVLTYALLYIPHRFI